jgi:hypothetical protein
MSALASIGQIPYDTHMLPARPLTTEEVQTRLCDVLAAYTARRPTDTTIRAAAAAVAALAEHGWGSVLLEFDNNQLRTVKTEPTFRFPVMRP